MHEALCEIEAQPCLSCEDKGKASLSVDGIAYAASTWGAQSLRSRAAKFGAQRRGRREASLASPNQRVLVSSANFAPLSEVKGVTPSADSVTYTAAAPKGTSKVPSRKAGIKALYSASYLHHNAKIKAPLCAKTKAIIASLATLSSTKLALGGGAKSLASLSEANTTGEVVLP